MKGWTEDEIEAHITSSGVYMITCEPTGNYYIGISNRVEIRWAEHERALLTMKYVKNGEDYGKGIWQMDYDEHGYQAFSRKLICKRNNVHLQRALEAHLIKRFSPTYNKVHRNKDAEQKPFMQREVDVFLGTYLPKELNMLAVGKPYKWSKLWARLVTLRATGLTSRTKSEFTEMIQSIYPDQFSIQKGNITRLK